MIKDMFGINDESFRRKVRAIKQYEKSESIVVEKREQFEGNFQSLAKMFLKTSKKYGTWEECERTYFTFGGKNGVSYSNSPVKRGKLCDFFDKINTWDKVIKSNGSSEYYARWVQFLSCFEDGVSYLLENFDVGSSIKVETNFNNAPFFLIIKPNRYNDEGEKEERIIEKQLASILINDGVCLFTFSDGEVFNFEEIEDIWQYYLASEYLDEVIKLRELELKKEVEVSDKVVSQYKLFLEKASPYLQLDEL